MGAKAPRVFGVFFSGFSNAAIAFVPLLVKGMVSAILMAVWLGVALAEPVTAARHQALKANYARAETRWPDAEFWRWRRG
jgi:hypothetical protein